MVNIIINKRTKIKMPNKASEISLIKGIQIYEFVDEKKDKLNFTDKVFIISLLSGIDVKVLKLFGEPQIDLIYSKIEVVRDTFKIFFPLTFKLKNKEYGLIDVENMTVREMSEIDFYLKEGQIGISNIPELMSILYRPIKRKIKSPFNILINIIFRLKYKNIIPVSFKHYEVEDFEDKHLKNKELFLKHCDFSFGVGALNLIHSFKLKLKDEYKLLYKVEDEDTEEETKKQLEFSEIWGDYHTICEISQNIFERDAWYKKPVKEYYKYLVYKKQKFLYELRNGKGQ